MRVLSFLAILALIGAFQAHAASQTVYKWVDDEGVTHYTDSPPEGREFEQRAAASGTEVTPPPEETPAPPSPAVVQANANCDIARRNVQTLANAANISLDTDGDGKVEPLDDQQRAVQLAHYQEMVSMYCKAEPEKKE